MEKWNIQLEHGQPMEQTRGLFCMCDSGWLARCSERTAQASELAAVNQICVVHEAMNGCKNLKIH